MGRSDKQPTQDEFAKLVIDGLRRAGVTDEISYAAEPFLVSVEGTKESTLFLDNAYREYCTVAEEHRSGALQRLIRGWLQAQKSPPEEYADIRPDVLPAVRSRSFFESAQLRMELEGNEDTFLPYQMLGDDLGIGLVYDMPNSMKPISNKELGVWDVTFYEALESARENLAQLRPRIVGPKEGEGVYVFTTNDGYDSSRLILLELIRQFQVRGDPIAMAPGREMLIVAGSDDTSGLEAMVALAKKVLRQPRPVSGVALKFDGDQWVAWMPDAADLLYDEFRMLRMLTFGQDYAEQKDLLDRLHEKTGEAISVEPFSVMKHRQTGHQTSYCVWTKGSRCLLPKTERIVLGGEGLPTVTASWERVVEVAGPLLTPVDIYPERYRVEEFPTAEQLAAMRQDD